MLAAPLFAVPHFLHTNPNPNFLINGNFPENPRNGNFDENPKNGDSDDPIRNQNFDEPPKNLDQTPKNRKFKNGNFDQTPKNVDENPIKGNIKNGNFDKNTIKGSYINGNFDGLDEEKYEREVSGKSALERYQKLGTDETKLFYKIFYGDACSPNQLVNIGHELNAILAKKFDEIQFILAEKKYTYPSIAIPLPVVASPGSPSPLNPPTPLSTPSTPNQSLSPPSTPNPHQSFPHLPSYFSSTTPCFPIPSSISTFASFSSPAFTPSSPSLFSPSPAYSGFYPSPLSSNSGSPTPSRTPSPNLPSNIPLNKSTNLIPAPLDRGLNMESAVNLDHHELALVIEEQPTGNVVANKYLEPPLTVRVDKKYLNLAKEGKLEVSAVLCVTLKNQIIEKTIDNKQNILQGHTVVSVSSDGLAVFNKLKIMEVSSKHHHQPFSISLQLQELKKDVGYVSIGEPVKSAALHVQSRINKRKRSSSYPTKPKKRVRGDSDCNYVDITPLLVLPQKEAATRLGISESMLCKRFKECTRRKWPYRYLRKIDKMLRLLTFNKKEESLSVDQRKIMKLQREREECLHPVKIRISGNDKISSNLSGFLIGKKSENDNESESESEVSSNSSPYEEEENGGEIEENLILSISANSLSNSGNYGISSSPGVQRRISQGNNSDELSSEEDEITAVASTLNLLRKGEPGLWV